MKKLAPLVLAASMSCATVNPTLIERLESNEQCYGVGKMPENIPSISMQRSVASAKARVDYARKCMGIGNTRNFSVQMGYAVGHPVHISYDMEKGIAIAYRPGRK